MDEEDGGWCVGACLPAGRVGSWWKAGCIQDEWQGLQEGQVVGREVVAGPLDDALVGFPEMADRHASGHTGVVVAFHAGDAPLAHQIHDLIGLRTIPHQVPEADDGVRGLGVEVREHGFERGQVGVEVGDEGEAQGWWVVGSWQLAVGSWQLAVGSWQLALRNLRNLSHGQRSTVNRFPPPSLRVRLGPRVRRRSR